MTRDAEVRRRRRRLRQIAFICCILTLLLTAWLTLGSFSFRSLLGNAVLRWEYRPGSVLFLVWQQNRNGAQPFGDFDASRDVRAIFDESPENIVAIKATYWLGL